MGRSVEHLREGRASKVRFYLARNYKEHPPWTFILEHCNTAAYGKFRTSDDAERVYKLWKETNMTTKETNTGNTVADLTNAVTVARQAEQQAQVGQAEAVARLSKAETYLREARLKHDDAKVALGKAKLTEAIALIDKVHSEAPKGSAAAKDIENLLERIMQRRLLSAFQDLPYASPFVQVSQPVRFSASNPNLQQVAKPGAETTAAVKAETSVSGGGHQAKPTPAEKYVPQVGDKVRYTAVSNGYYEQGAVYTISRTTSPSGTVGYVQVEEKAGDAHHNISLSKLVLIERKPAEQCNYPFCNCATQQVNECKKA